MVYKPKSNLTPEERKAQKIFHKMKAHAQHIKDKDKEYLLSFDREGNFVFEHTDEKQSEVGYGDHNWYTEVVGHMLVHNHPRGNCFSPEDLNMGKYVKEIWAVTGDRIQIFRWNKNDWNIKDGESQGSWEMNANAFMNKLKSKYDNGEFFSSASKEWNDKHGGHAIDAMKYKNWDDYKKAVDKRAEEVIKITQRKQREFFKNNQEIYGFTFTERKWK